MKNILFLSILFITFNLKGQQLNIRETLDYIESIENIYSEGYSMSRVKYELNSEGLLIKYGYDIRDDRNKHGNNELTSRRTVHVDDIIKEVNIDNWDDNSITLKCKNKNCFSLMYYSNMKIMYGIDYGRITFAVSQEYQAKKMINAINYLFSLIENEKFFRDINDPFAKNISYSNEGSEKTDKISLKEKNGIFIVNVNFKNVSAPFILDSGAAEISISSTLEKELITKGIINKNDYLSDGLYRVADGRIVSQRRVMLKQVTVGKFTIRNIPASIGGENIPLLLGKNFFDKFNHWSINNSENILELKL